MTTDKSQYKPFRFIDDDGDGQFGLELAADAGIGWQVFGELGYVGNGHDWTRVIRNLLKQSSPQTIQDLKFSSEADFFVVYSRKKASLKTIVDIVSVFFDDREKLKAVIQQHGNYS